MKIGIAQINTTVGDLNGNRKKILSAYHKLVKQKAELIVFPELAICGYPPRDLLMKSNFSKDVMDTLNHIASKIQKIPAIIGTIEIRANKKNGRPLFNSIAWCHNGSIKKFGRKCLLPNYDVFDEERYFEPYKEPLVFQWKNNKIGITICEDIWIEERIYNRRRYSNNPINFLKNEKIDLLINTSASPWYLNKENTRRLLIKKVTKKLNVPVVYCNAIGGNDELVFDGGSFISFPNSDEINSMNYFKEELKVFDTKSVTNKKINEDNEISKIYNALTLGLKDYAKKSNFSKVVIGLSGGIDSAVVASLAVKSLGAKNVTGIAMPSNISSKESLFDAKKLAKNLGINFKKIPIKSTFQSIEKEFLPHFKNLDKDVTEENIQARIRGLFLMAISNKFKSLLLTTGNKSELAVGYCTLYGDMCGGLALISDIPKMKVYELANYINRYKEIIPIDIINKEPSAELSPGQKDQDSLPSYVILDEILYLYIELSLSKKEIIAKGFNSKVVDSIIKKVDQNEYKRNQAAPGIKITSLAFGIGRRMPIVQKYLN